MDLLILREPSQYPEPGHHYRGTDREGPQYVTELPEEHPANQVFLRYLDAVGRDQLLHDKAQARSIVEAYGQLDPPQTFEIVEVTRDDQEPALPGELLGYDVAALSGSMSLIKGGLDLDQLKAYQADPAAVEPLMPLIALVTEHFRPQFNAFGLFRDYATAEFCYACIVALYRLRPALSMGWELDSAEHWTVLGVWRV